MAKRRLKQTKAARAARARYRRNKAKGRGRGRGRKTVRRKGRKGAKRRGGDFWQDAGNWLLDAGEKVMGVLPMIL